MAKQWITGFDSTIDQCGEVLRRQHNLNRAFYVLTESANHSLLWHGLNLALNLPQDRRRLIRTAAVLGAESALINGGLKKAFKRSRPVHDAVRPHRLRSPKTTSFPSGHATSAFCAAAMLGDGRSRRFKALLHLIAVLVSYSRIHVRLHHPSDVVGGIAIGIGLGALAKKLWPIETRAKSSATER